MFSGQINTSTVDLQQLKKLSNINDINRLLHETLAKERNIDVELEKLLAKRNVIEGSLADLEGGTSELLEVVRADGEALAGSVHNTSALAEGVSRKVRQLDTAQSRVQETLAGIQLLLQRTHAIDGIRLAMDGGDFEAAAEHVRNFLELEKRGGPASAPRDSKQAEEQAQILASAQQKLRGVVRAKLEGAAHSGDHQTVLRYTRLFPPLGLQEEGLQWFTQYLQQLVRVRAKEDYDALVDGGKDGAFVVALSNLFKDVADAIEANQDFLREGFGQEALLEVMAGLQQECDVQGTRILQRYISYRRLEKVAKEISTLDAAKRVEGSSTDQAHTVDPRMVEGYLEEMLVLCQRSEEYNGFMLAKMAEACAPALLGAARENAFRSGQFNVVVRELIAYYINMEEFYVEENVEKAIRIDDYQGDALTTSMVDDVFYILQKCGHRALSSANLQCACAILGQMNNLLASNLRQALDSRWKGAATRLLQVVAGLSPEGLTSSKDTGIAAEQAAVFNNAETSASYVMKLKAEVEEMGMDVFRSPGDRDRIKSVLADLSKTSSDFKAITSKALDHLANGLVPRLRPIWDEVAGMNYEMTEAEYAACEVEDTWVQRLLASLALLFTFLQPLFTASNWDSLVSILLDKVVDRVEAAMQVKRFNQLGGLQLDRDVRNLVATVSDMTQRTVRDKFAKLNQMATILMLESVAEMADYWGDNSGPLTWRLTEAQVREVLGQRVDFSPHDIALLVL